MPAPVSARIEALDGEGQGVRRISIASMCLRRRGRSTSAACRATRSAPLHGIPVAIKDIIDTADYPTELGSPLAAGRRPRRDADRRRQAARAGAVIIGKTVTTEFAYFHPGPTRNPHDHARTPAVRHRDRRRRSPPIWCRSRSARRPTGR
jgi:Asp-tRNA(Asn)/Glu-tRNA(Gln) amidotransferase A subunit family amidase